MFSITKKFFTAIIFILLLIVVTNPSRAIADTVTPYQPQTVLEYISYLQGIVDSLRAQLAAQQADSTVSSSYSSRVKTYAAEVVIKAEVELSSSFDVGSASYAYAWFEYGEGSSLNKKTTRVRERESGGDVEHTRVLTGLKTGTTYRYRAVFESSSGTKYYGAIKTFNTGKYTSSSSNDDDDENGTSVTKDSVTLSTNKNEYEEGDSIKVSWEIPSSRESSTNWIGMYKVDDSNSQHILWKYLDNDNEGTITFTAPSTEDEYEFRLFYNNSYDDVITSREIEVVD